MHMYIYNTYINILSITIYMPICVYVCVCLCVCTCTHVYETLRRE